MNDGKTELRDLVRIPLMSVVIVVCSWISVPAPVPFTLQTFGVFCALLLLGGRRGTLSVLLYILLGAAGLPVFAGFNSGLGALLGPTGGYILGFLLCALLYRLLEGKAKDALILALGNLVCYAFGTLWFVIVYSSGEETIGFGAALMMCVVPYILPDALKLALALIVSRRLSPLISRARGK